MVDSIKILICVIIVIPQLLASSSAYAQVKEDLTFIIQSNNLSENKTDDDSSLSFRTTSELKLAGLGLIRFYQILISSQDMSACTFTLSCSRFSQRAIRRFGFFHGVPMTADRLQRCNGLSRRYYTHDSKSGLAVDYPLEKYYIGNH